MDLELTGKTALVTGASSGIGRGTALTLAREGVRVAIQGRDTGRLAEVAKDITDAGGAEPVVIACELLEADAAARIVDAAIAGLGTLGIVVNNAGASWPLEIDSTEQEWSDATTLNFVRPRQIASLAIAEMRRNHWGRIVNVTGKSESVMLNGAVTAKAAVHAWSKGVSRKIGKDGITINCVAPGKIMSAQILRNYTEEFRARQAAEDIPVGRYGSPADMANMITYLCSPLAGYITGAVIPVDGGLRRYYY